MVSPSALITTDTNDSLLFKTTDRALYEEHDGLARETAISFCDSRPDSDPTGSTGALSAVQVQSTLLHVGRPSPGSSHVVTETTIANLLFLPPHATRWITPVLSAAAPFLPGLMRAELLASGEVEEMEVRLEDAQEWVRGGGRVACCNALRGVWDVDLIFP